MQQAIEAYEKDGFKAMPVETHVQRLHEYAKKSGYEQLAAALEQRYPKQF